MSLACGLLLLPIAILASPTPLIWLNVGACLVFAAAFFVIHIVKQPRPATSRRRNPNRWRQNAAALTALITALSGLVTSAVAFVRAGPEEGKPPAAKAPDECRQESKEEGGRS